MSDVYETLYYEGEIERLEAELAGVTELLREGSKALGILKTELAEANAKIEAVRAFHPKVDVELFGMPHSYCDLDETPWPCENIRTLESATPQPEAIE